MDAAVRPVATCLGLGALLAAFLSSACLIAADTAPNRRAAGDVQWIWSNDQAATQAPAGVCYFRRSFPLVSPERGQVVIACDDRYELFVNGRSVGSGGDWRKLDSYDISRLLVSGPNSVAVKCENLEPGSAGLVARVTVRQAGHTDISYSSDASWRFSRQEYRNWQRAGFDDRAWQAARVLGEFGRTAPWLDQVRSVNGTAAGRFKIAPGFHVERVAEPAQTGSLIAMTFNEWGDIVAAREAGPIVLIRDLDADGVWESSEEYSKEVKNCQGLLALNGQIYAVADGPAGAALYRLSDEDRDGLADRTEPLIKFKGNISEHGAHAPILGPDGMIYLVLGNHAQAPEAAPSSPYRTPYEGDLVQPRYEDPAGHAAGVKAPGGAILRTDLDGKLIEIIAGGLRNAYDIAFNPQGELFTWDSDNESDEGLPWYRPTRLMHVVPGAEFGWRSGWAVWPDSYLDCLPGVLDTGRGSPAGLVFYDHDRYPESFRGTLFAADWSRGRILAIRLTAAAGTYQAQSEPFLEGRPLNVTDLSVGRDGWLYFSTGGRGTEGGVYRIVFSGRQTPPRKDRGIEQALRQPQIQSAWSRERLAIIKDELGGQWQRELTRVALDSKAAEQDRTRALELMQWLGPYPSTVLLIQASKAEPASVRARAAYFMGIHADANTASRLTEMLEDRDPQVRRAACEAIARAEAQIPVTKLIPLLADRHRRVAYAARLTLQRLPREEWQPIVLAHTRPAIFLLGAAALMADEPDQALSLRVLDECSRRLQGFLSDEEFLGLLRVAQLALIRGQQSGDDLPQFREQLAEEYPSLDPAINRELVRLLVYLQAETANPRLLAEVSGKAAQPEKMHLLMHARFMTRGWNTEQKLAWLELYEQARGAPGGPGLGRFVEAGQRDFFALLNADEQSQVLAEATRFPGAALSALVQLPVDPGPEMLTYLEQLDRQLPEIDTPAARQLQVGIVAILARSRQPQAFAHLRDVFDRQPDRRAAVAMGLAQSPAGENWPLLVRSLTILDGAAAQEVLTRLTEVDQTPDQPEPIRQVILCGLKLGEPGGAVAIPLLEKWTGQRASQPGDSAKVALAAWQKWFRQHYPDQPDPALPEESAEGKWTLDDLLTFLDSADGAAGDATRGELVFEKALCIKCHRHGDRGEAVGPDLTSITRRFQTREILESVLFPSHVISDQFATKSVQTVNGQTFVGMVGLSGQNAIVVLDSQGRKTTIERSQIEEVAPHKKSAMPEGLFNNLTLEEIADLFAYLGRSDQRTVNKSAPRGR